MSNTKQSRINYIMILNFLYNFFKARQTIKYFENDKNERNVWCTHDDSEINRVPSSSNTF